MTKKKKLSTIIINVGQGDNRKTLKRSFSHQFTDEKTIIGNIYRNKKFSASFEAEVNIDKDGRYFLKEMPILYSNGQIYVKHIYCALLSNFLKVLLTTIKQPSLFVKAC